MKATVQKYINKNKQNAAGEHPVSIKITFLRDRKYYSTGISSPPNGKISKDNTAFIDTMVAKAVTVINELGANFSFETFEKLFLQKRTLKDTLEAAFLEVMGELEEDRVGRRQAYECSLVSFLKFHPKAKISDITPKWLKEYEQWMDAQGRSKATVGMYTRDLRAVLKKMVSDGRVIQERYPFGEGKYQPPTGHNIKKALTLTEIGKIAKHELPEGSTAKRMRDYWIFLYLCNGINVADFCHLKYSNVNGNKLTFIREKTKRTKRDVKKIEIVLHGPAAKVIKDYGDKSLNKHDYIFPHLESGMDYETQDKTIANLVRLINDYMKDIAAAIGIKKDITTYYARHSFATILKNSGTPVAMISQLLGHSNIGTTENYLDGFESSAVEKATAVLLDFKKAKNA